MRHNGDRRFLQPPAARTALSRRAFLGLGAGVGLAALVACSGGDDPTAEPTGTDTSTPAPTQPPSLGSQPSPAGSYTVSQMNAALASGERIYWAHRGGSRNWSEMTMLAYTNAVWHGAKMLEVSAHLSSDGVWIMSHDRDLSRITATDYVIAQTPAATMLGTPVEVPAPGGVIGRLDEVLQAYGNLVLIVDNKTNENMAEFLSILATVPDATDHIIIKIDGNATMWPFTEAKAAGFAVAGYWGPTNVNNFLPDRAPYTDYIGMAWDAPQEYWDFAASYGKPLWGHVIADTVQADMAIAKGAQILQCADVVGLIPPGR
jgi:hypothetical protein